MKRRKFLEKTALTGVGITAGAIIASCQNNPNAYSEKQSKANKNSAGKVSPIAICTWGFTEANETAGKALAAGKEALDAVLEGVAIEEENISNNTVGKGGKPDREGNVTLDACVMNPAGDCGSVVCVSDIVNVAALARKVMEDTPHVMLAGEGATEFALKNGFKKENLLTEESRANWEEWKKSPEYQPIINIENHDTIGMLAIDSKGDIAGACTTSGLGYKMKGRVGDSPIIGAGLYLDNEIGGAVATGLGEAVMKSVGSFLIVELMRIGMSPQAACEEAVKRIVKKNENYKDFQVAFIAMNKAGEVGAFCIQKGFSYMKYQDEKNERHEAGYVVG